MDKAKIEKYKNVYRNEVLPKKSVLKNTEESFMHSLAIHDEMELYRKSANEVVLGGKRNGSR